MAWNPTTQQWEFAAYGEQTTAAARLAMATQFQTELMNSIMPRAQANGESIDPAVVELLLKQVREDLVRLRSEADAATGIGLPRFVATRVVDVLGGDRSGAYQ